MADLHELDFGDELEGGYTRWTVRGIVTDADHGHRIGVTVVESREGSVRDNAFDQDDLDQFEVVT